MPLKIVFCGTPAFAVPTLLHLIAQPDFEVVGVVTQPDRPRGRGGDISMPAVKSAAIEAGILVYQPEKIKTEEGLHYFERLAPDVVVIIAYGQIISARLIGIPRLGWINLHGSLLPKYRGAAPVNWAIVNGEVETGLTTMQIDPGLDTGPTLLKYKTEIDPDETAPELMSRLAEEGGPLMTKTLRQFASGKISPIPQDDSQKSFAPILKKEDGRIDWSLAAPQIYNRIRGLQPWPGAFSTFRGKTCNIWGKPSPQVSPAGVPGTLSSQGTEMLVSCGYSTALRIEFLQLEDASASLRGNSQTARALAPSKNLVISPARKIAFDVLRLVEEEDAYASDILHARLTSHVKTEDAALATELAMGVLRWRSFLDFLLQRSLKQPIARLDLPVTLALRLGAYQLRFLRRVPARAAVNESVELVKRSRKTSAATLVNAVLRRISSETAIPADQLVPAALPQLERLSILQSHPEWMIERWIADFGEEMTIALLHANNAAPRLSCAIHSTEQHGEILTELTTAGMNVEDGLLLNTAIAVSGGSPARTEAFRTGKISIQDEASQAIPLLLDVHAGDQVLDVCAAPGGKTTQLARAATSEGCIVAADLHGHRLRAMRAQLDRLILPDVRMVQLDAMHPLPFATNFDRILVDAPCSGTGTLARHPEIRWRLRLEQLKEFHKLQVEILCNAAARLAPGGKLVYSTCSLESEENEQVVTEALQKVPGLRVAPKSGFGRSLQQHFVSNIQLSDLLDEVGHFRTMPGRHRTDGFFAAVMVREQG